MTESNQAQVDGIAARRHLKSEKRRAKREWPVNFLVALF
jgi:hypothetical protein